jgi:diguanylate cyclase (GGDEF)-like protein
VTPGQSCEATLDQLVRVGIVCVAGVGAAAILGYFFAIPHLESWTASPMSMKVNTAFGLVAAATALWLVHVCAPETPWIRIARGLAVAVAAIGILTLAEDLFRFDLGIDELILPDTAPQLYTSHVGRMSPGTAFNLTIIGLALLGLKARQSRLAAIPHWLIVPALLVATLAVIGHAYGVSALYEVKSNTSMAAPTAVAFLVLGLCLLAADSAHGFASIATSDTAGGLVSRRLLPTIPVILFVLGWVRLQGQIHSFYDTRFGLALMVLGSIIVCIIAVVTTANTLHRTDLTRQRAEAEILSLNVGLELRVQERTQQLAQVSSQLGIVNRSLEELSRRDGLTGLANRRFFDTYLADQIRIARRHKRALALVLCDVDSFKAYNDHYGHPAGDECLKRVAAALRSCCHRPGDMAARYGGEEFALILPDTELGAAVIIAEAARAAVADLKIVHTTSITAAYVSISGGVAVLSRIKNASAQQLIADADLNLFQAKHLGRNQMFAVHAKVA